MIEAPTLSSSFVQKPKTRVSSTSEIDPTYKGDEYHTAPFGVQATRNLQCVNILVSFVVIKDSNISWNVRVSSFSSKRCTGTFAVNHLPVSDIFFITYTL